MACTVNGFVLAPCSFSFMNKDCQGLHSKYKIDSLQWKICQNVTALIRMWSFPLLSEDQGRQIQGKRYLNVDFMGQLLNFYALRVHSKYCVLISTSYRSMGASCCSCCSLMVWYSFSNFFSFFWLICWAVRAEKKKILLGTDPPHLMQL